MDVFEVMAEPIRRRIIEVLASGEHYAGDLEAIVMHEFGVGRAAVQHHLRLLREHGHVVTRDDWPYRGYRLDPRFIGRIEYRMRLLKKLWRRRIGWDERTDPATAVTIPSSRGRRGRGADPDDPWVRRLLDT